MTAATAVPQQVAQMPGMRSVGDDGDATDDQIAEMLARATQRMKERSRSAQPTAQSQLRLALPKLDPGTLDTAYVSPGNAVAKVDGSRLLEQKHRKQANGFRKVEDPTATKKLALQKKKASAGPNWFDMPRTDLTPELKRDLQLIKMRNVLDPHRHYKKDNGKMKAPEYSQVGTIQEGPTEFFSGRIENKKRKRTIVEEVLDGEHENGRFKKKYGELQDKKTSGKKAFYKAMKAKRKSNWKQS